MNSYFRQCFYFKEKQKIYIFLEDTYVYAESEEEALADLLEKYIDNDEVVCYASLIYENVLSY